MLQAGLAESSWEGGHDINGKHCKLCVCVSESAFPYVCPTCGSCPGTDWLCPSQSIRLSFCPRTQRASVIYHQFSVSRHTHTRSETHTSQTSNLNRSHPKQNLRNPSADASLKESLFTSQMKPHQAILSFFVSSSLS